MHPYTGHPSQFYGIEEHRLTGGKGDGLRLLQVRTGGGFEYTVCPDRCADIPRLSYKGFNMGFFAPAGYVSPAYYDKEGDGFLKSFNAGFLTTCGLFQAGAPNNDEGEELPLHGNIANTPCERVLWDFNDEELIIKGVVRDARLFGRRLELVREIRSKVGSHEFSIKDTITNYANETAPIMVLYHFNMGYPLLSEKSIVNVPYKTFEARDPRAAEGNDMKLTMEKPQTYFPEQCWFYDLKEGRVSIFNPDIGCGIAIEFDRSGIDCFTEWKNMEYGEYVLGLEPGNCIPTGRADNRKRGILKFLEPGKSVTYDLKVKGIDEPD